MVSWGFLYNLVPRAFPLKTHFFKGKALGTRLGFCSQFLLLFSHAKPTNLFIACCTAARKSVADLQIVERLYQQIFCRMFVEYKQII